MCPLGKVRKIYFNDYFAVLNGIVFGQKKITMYDKPN